MEEDLTPCYVHLTRLSNEFIRRHTTSQSANTSVVRSSHPPSVEASESSQEAPGASHIEKVVSAKSSHLEEPYVEQVSGDPLHLNYLLGESVAINPNQNRTSAVKDLEEYSCEQPSVEDTSGDPLHLSYLHDDSPDGCSVEYGAAEDTIPAHAVEEPKDDLVHASSVEDFGDSCQQTVVLEESKDSKQQPVESETTDNNHKVPMWEGYSDDIIDNLVKPPEIILESLNEVGDQLNLSTASTLEISGHVSSPELCDSILSRAKKTDGIPHSNIIPHNEEIPSGPATVLVQNEEADYRATNDFINNLHPHGSMEMKRSSIVQSIILNVLTMADDVTTTAELVEMDYGLRDDTIMHQLEAKIKRLQQCRDEELSRRVQNDIVSSSIDENNIPGTSQTISLSAISRETSVSDLSRDTELDNKTTDSISDNGEILIQINDPTITNTDLATSVVGKTNEKDCSNVSGNSVDTLSEHEMQVVHNNEVHNSNNVLDSTFAINSDIVRINKVPGNVTVIPSGHTVPGRGNTNVPGSPASSLSSDNNKEPETVESPKVDILATALQCLTNNDGVNCFFPDNPLIQDTRPRCPSPWEWNEEMFTNSPSPVNAGNSCIVNKYVPDGNAPCVNKNSLQLAQQVLHVGMLMLLDGTLERHSCIHLNCVEDKLNFCAGVQTQFRNEGSHFRLLVLQGTPVDDLFKNSILPGLVHLQIVSEAVHSDVKQILLYCCNNINNNFSMPVFSQDFIKAVENTYKQYVREKIGNWKQLDLDGNQEPDKFHLLDQMSNITLHQLINAKRISDVGVNFLKRSEPVKPVVPESSSAVVPEGGVSPYCKRSCESAHYSPTLIASEPLVQHQPFVIPLPVPTKTMAPQKICTIDTTRMQPPCNFQVPLSPNGCNSASYRKKIEARAAGASNGYPSTWTASYDDRVGTPLSSYQLAHPHGSSQQPYSNMASSAAMDQYDSSYYNYTNYQGYYYYPNAYMSDYAIRQDTTSRNPADYQWPSYTGQATAENHQSHRLPSHSPTLMPWGQVNGSLNQEASSSQRQVQSTRQTTSSRNSPLIHPWVQVNGSLIQQAGTQQKPIQNIRQTTCAEQPIQNNTATASTSNTVPVEQEVSSKATSLVKCVCEVCEKSARMICGSCKKMFYCSKECQVSHWNNGHYENCPIVLDD